MASSEHFLARFLELPRVQDKEVRRGIFRQTIAALGQDDQAGGPLALAGVDPRALGRSIEVATADGLLDNLDFIGAHAAAVAIYQIAGALPLGGERRIMGRKLLAYLYQGNAETFASLAARMALGSARPLKGAGIRARVALSTCLRTSADSATDRLALSILMRRELSRDWVSHSATAALPDRRLAARLIERAAREAARRADAGDVYPLRVFRGIVNPGFRTPPRPDGGDGLAPAWHALLADRETLVWRHVAVARGLLSGAVPEFVDETASLFRTDLTPTEWRRGATSLVARIAVERSRGLSDAMGLLDGPLLKRDPGIAMAMVWGLLPVAEVEPEAAEELAEAIASIAPISIADSLVELRAQVPSFGTRAAQICITALRSSLSQPELDDGLSALAASILEDLEATGEPRRLARAVASALEAYGEHGALEAQRLAREALAAATERIGTLESLEVSYHAGAGSTDLRRRAMELLREVDATLLESRVLTNLLLLDRPPGSETTGVEAVDDLDARLARWLLDKKRRDASGEELKQQSTLQQRQLRTLLHLIDGGSTDFGDDNERRLRVRTRWTTAVRTFVQYLREQPATPLTRAIIATIARACDALVRDGAAEPVDIFLFAAVHLSEPQHLAVVAEASMQPDVVQLLSHYLAFAQGEFRGPEPERARIESFKRFLHGYPSQRTLRGEAFRTTAWTLVRALEHVISADALASLVPAESASARGPLAAVEDAIAQLQQLVMGAERRCSDQAAAREVLPHRHALAQAVDNAVRTETTTGLLEALTATARAAEASLPSHLAAVVTGALPRLTTLPLERGPMQPIPLVHEKHANLPDWLPPRRIIGGFYVLRQLGGGNVGTVFVVKRAEERHDADAERFALKVPEYNATAARTMSEQEFLKLFREEAGALLAIPEHPNIARFVTFDAGARPKPILVMELVEGVSLERVISAQSLQMDHALAVLDSTIAGLSAMHASGIAHLDVKPSNIVMRERSGETVLVDFGLAGRRVRPGCATLCYGAPEIWETAPGAKAPGQASAADVYAVGCLAYEVMTGRTLFDGTSDVGIISSHITHDGLPPPVERLAKNPAFQPFAELLYHCLRYDPNNRASMAQVREELQKIGPGLARERWPLEGA